MLYILYFKQYDTYHDTHEAILNRYQQYILSGFRPKKLDMSTNIMKIWNCNDLNTLNLKAKMYHLKYHLSKMNNTICMPC